jgi:uncharacterized protein (TIRG00374 family)
MPLTEIRSTLGLLSPPRLALLAGFNLFAMLFFSSRWWLILRALGYKLPYLPLVGHRMAGFSISYFTPGTQFGGEPLQAYLLQARHGVPPSASLVSISLDKMFELISNFTFLAIGILLVLRDGMFRTAAPFQSVLWMGGVFFLPLAYLLALWAGGFPLTWLAGILPEPLVKKPALQKVLPVITSAERQISTLFRQKPATLAWASVASGLIWLLSLGEYWLSIHLLGAQLNLWQTVGALTLARLAFLTPLPGGLGALEASQAIAMQALGFSPALGLSLSLWIRARDLVLGSIGLAWLALNRRHRDTALPVMANNAASADLAAPTGD